MIHSACNALAQGEMVIVFDSPTRENECDFFVSAEFCTPAHIQTMRTLGGGLIFLALPAEIGTRFGLCFLTDIYEKAAHQYPLLETLMDNDLKYDRRSAFSITINHRDTFTGITDNDRALTITDCARIAQETATMNAQESQTRFAHTFRSPGHVPLCIADPKLFDERQGHTELSVALSLLAGCSGICVGCEILDSNGKAKTREATKSLAQEMKLAMVSGDEIIAQWREHLLRSSTIQSTTKCIGT